MKGEVFIVKHLCSFYVVNIIFTLTFTFVQTDVPKKLQRTTRYALMKLNTSNKTLYFLHISISQRKTGPILNTLSLKLIRIIPVCSSTYIFQINFSYLSQPPKSKKEKERKKENNIFIKRFLRTDK